MHLRTWQLGRQVDIIINQDVIQTLASAEQGNKIGDSAIEIRKEVLTNHVSYRKHFESICFACADSIRTIMETFKDFN